MNFTRRPNSSDDIVIREIMTDDCYRWQKNGSADGLVVDIGANIGVFTCVAALTNFVVAFEPEPNNFTALVEHVNQNQLSDRVSCVRLAVGTPGMSSIHSQSGGSRLHTEGAKVPVVSLDTALFDYPTVDFLKIDCEGSEYEVFDTVSPKTLQKIKRFAGEFHPDLVSPETHQRVIAKLEEVFSLEITGNIPKAGGIIYGVKKHETPKK